MRNIPLKLSYLAALLSLSACQKNWLDAKPDTHLVVINTLQNFQLLEDNTLVVSENALGESAADNYYISQLGYPYLQASDVAQYEWCPNGEYGVPSQGDWAYLYKGIYSSNTVLDGLPSLVVAPEDQALYNQVKGAALFNRGLQYYELAQTFCKAYDSSTAASDPGLPLRLSTSLNPNVGRGTVSELYQQIFSDLKASVSLLPSGKQLYRTRPNRPAAFAVLARASLAIGNYTSALLYSDSVISYDNVLLDYNTITPNGTLTMPAFDQNPEVIIYSDIYDAEIDSYNALIDTTLYASYDSDDLRKILFFGDANNFVGAPGWTFIGTYDGTYTSTFFSSPALDEIYLIRSECNARAGNLSAALTDFNYLMTNRYKAGTWVGYSSSNLDSVLFKILTERRKELVMRGTRWSDLRRLNKDSRFAQTIIHSYNGTVFTLQPNSNQYVFPIPDDEIIASGIAQNPR